MLTLVASVTRRWRSRSLAPFGASAERLVRPVRLAALGILILPALLHAQRLFGAGEDASVLKPREWRWSFGARWTSWDEALDGAGQRSAINGRFTNPDAGPAFFGGLLATQGFLRSAMGDSTVRVSMGAARLRSELHQDRIPIALEVGISKRLTVGLYVPLVNTYAGAAFDLNRLDPSSANVGLNPGFQNNTFASAAGTVQAEASAAVAALQVAFPSCFSPTPGAGCASTIALAQNTTALGLGVARVFGFSGRFAPVVGGALDNALRARFTSINTQLRTALGVPAAGADPILARPNSAPTRMALADFNTVLLTSGYEVRGDTLTALERSALGDVEVSARWQWLNTFEGARRDSGRVNPAGWRVRSLAGVTARLATGAKPYLGQLLDIGTGDGATGIELRSTTDVTAGDHFWMSITGRYTHMLADEVERRLPLSTLEALVPSYRRQRLSRQLGDYAELEVTPRWMFNDYFAVSADYFLYLRRATTYGGGPFTVSDPYSGLPVTLDPAVLGVPHEIAQRAGIGIAYSTVAAHGRGTTRLPLDIRWQRIITLGGENTPYAFQDRLELRIITSLFGKP